MDESKFFTLTALSASTISFGQLNTSKVFSYQKNGTGSYQQVTSATTISLQEGEYARFYCPNTGDTTFNTAGNGSSSTWSIRATGAVKASGHITSLINENCPNTMGKYCFYWLFMPSSTDNRNDIVDASELILPTTTSEACYQDMFTRCNIVHAPKLPATSLAEKSYYGMFSGCIHLVDDIILPATRLSNNCYRSMFKGCTSLPSANIYASQFLETAYYRRDMFRNCSNFNTLILPNLINAPSTSDTTWLISVAATGTVYQNAEATWDKSTASMGIPKGWTVETYTTMYNISLFTTNVLKCTLSGGGLYSSGDTVTLTATPETGYMIREWYDNDTQQPIQVQGNSYTFQATEDRNITVRVSAIENPTITANVSPQGLATITGGGTYDLGDTVTLTVSNIDENYVFDEWYDNNAQQPIQVQGYTYTFTAEFDRSITAKLRALQNSDYLTITAIQDSSISFSQYGIPTSVFYYQLNNGQFTQVTPSTIIPLQEGDTVRFKGNNESSFNTRNNGWRFNVVGETTVSGHITALFNISHPNNISEYAFKELFKGCSGIKDASGLILPTVTAEGCFYSMFSDCENMVHAPQVLATTIERESCCAMFYDCEKLEDDVYLPATEIKYDGARQMYHHCARITYAELGFSNLANYACYGLFEFCYYLQFIELTNLTTSPSSENGNYQALGNWLNYAGRTVNLVGFINCLMMKPQSATWNEQTNGMHMSISENNNFNTLVTNQTKCRIKAHSNRTTTTFAGTGVVLPNQTVKVRANSVNDNEVLGWYDDDTHQLIQSTGNTLTFTATSDRNVTAQLTTLPIYTVSAISIPEGALITEGVGQYEQGAKVTISARIVNPKEYKFDHLSVTPVGPGRPNVAEFTLTGDTTVNCYATQVITIPIAYSDKPTAIEAIDLDNDNTPCTLWTDGNGYVTGATIDVNHRLQISAYTDYNNYYKNTVEGITLNGEQYGDTVAITATTEATANTITVNAHQTKVYIPVANPEGITITGEGYYDLGSKVTLNVSKTEVGYTFLHWDNDKTTKEIHFFAKLEDDNVVRTVVSRYRQPLRITNTSGYPIHLYFGKYICFFPMYYRRERSGQWQPLPQLEYEGDNYHQPSGYLYPYIVLEDGEYVEFYGEKGLNKNVYPDDVRLPEEVNPYHPHLPTMVKGDYDLQEGGKYCYGINGLFSRDFGFYSEGKYKVSGYLTSLFDLNCPDYVPDTTNFGSLFSTPRFLRLPIGGIETPHIQIRQNAIDDASELILPKNVNDTGEDSTVFYSDYPGTYSHMFENSKLRLPPSLPAMELEQSCYKSMFLNCDQLETSPTLPAKNTKEYSYAGMFGNCSGLTQIESYADNIDSYDDQWGHYDTEGWTAKYEIDWQGGNMPTWVPVTEYDPETYHRNLISSVPSAGTFVYSENAEWDDSTRDTRTIPYDWNGVPRNIVHVIVKTEPKYTGEVYGEGVYESGATITVGVREIGNGYKFNSWNYNNSTQKELTLTVTEDMELIAYMSDGHIQQGELGLDGLFIDGQRVDEFNDMDVSMTYQSRHTSSPEAVRSNFSKTVTLPGTPNNNNIFGNLYNPNATLTNFNPRERVEFKLYRNSEIVEKGYITLDEIVTDKDGNITYNVTLYGGLGDFFYSLQYDENGDELTLDLLSYPLTMENNHIVCFWDFEHIKQGWEKLKLPFDKNDRTPENYIVACPTYGGFGDDMDNNKAILLSKWYNGPDDEYGWNFWNGPVVTDYTPDQGEHFYCDRNGWIGVEAQREMSEWETRDLRSSQQRPAIRTKLIFDAICDPVNNGGYTVELSQSLSADTYLNDSWIVCDRLDFDNGDSNLNPIIVKSYKDRVITATVAPAVQMTEDEDVFDLSGMSNVHLQLCAYPMMYVENTQHVLQDSVREIFTAMETRAYARDSENNLIMRYTPVYSTVLKHYVEGDEYTSTQYHVFDQVYVANAYVFWLTDNYGHKSNVQVLMNHLIKDGFWVIEDEYKEYIAQWANVSTNQVTIHNVPIKKRKNARGDVWFVTEDVMPLTIDLPSESDVKVQYHSEVIAIPFAITRNGKKYNLSDCMYYNKTTPDFSVDTTGQLPSWDWNKDEINRRALTEWKVNVEQPRYDLWTIEDEQQDYEQFTAWMWDTFYISTGDNTQDDNFGSSYQAWQPIKYLDTWYEPIEDKDNEGAENGFYEGQLQSVQSTAVTKELLFGRMGTAYNFLMTLSKLLSLRFRMDKDDKKVYIERVFEYYKDNTIDITDRVDYSKEIKVIPNVTEYKYLDYTLESPEDLYINKLYNTKYHKPYGGYKFNTGINLSNDTNKIFESSPFNSTAEYNMKSPYFFINERVPQPYLLPYVQQTLYLDEAGSTSSSQVQTLERNGYSSIYRLNQIEGPTLLCMYDKEYKAVDTNMVLAFFNGFTPWKCIVSDNIKAMNELQNKNCVMSMYMHFADDITDVVAVSVAQQGFVPYLDGYIYGKPSTKTDSTERIAALMEDIPQFITTSNGKSTLISEPEHPFTEVGECIYPQYHMWSEDMYDRNGKKVELYMRMPKDIKPDEMLRNFIYWQNSIWVLESIEDYDIAKPDTVKVTLIKVRNKTNYLLNED